MITVDKEEEYFHKIAEKLSKKHRSVKTGKMSLTDAEIKTRILVQAQNDAVIVERLKRRIEELTLDENTKYNEPDHDHYVLKELQEILGEEKLQGQKKFSKLRR